LNQRVPSRVSTLRNARINAGQTLSKRTQALEARQLEGTVASMAVPGVAYRRQAQFAWGGVVVPLILIGIAWVWPRFGISLFFR